MAHKNMPFLNARRISGGYADTIINLFFELASALSCQSDSNHVLPLRSSQCLYDVARIAAGGNANGYIPCLAEGYN
jgi:hypothetical protein